VGFDSKTNPADPIEERGRGRDSGVSCCPRTLSCARVRGACGTINLSSDDALAALQISCRSRARPREGFSRGWAKAHPHPGPLSGRHILWKSPMARFLLPLRPSGAGQSHLARLLPFSPLSFPRKRESSAPKPVTRPWIPACAGMTATERSENPNAIALPLKGREGEKSKTAGNSPEMCPPWGLERGWPFPTGQRPLKLALRFSAKALTPSFASSESNARSKAGRSPRRVASKASRMLKPSNARSASFRA
jgi:hypothetical protein